jgi:hypothetical protein
LAIPERSAGTKTGWRFYVPVCFGIAAGASIILAFELTGSARLDGAGRDVGLILGGGLLGLIALCFYEILRAAPQRASAERERAAERQRQQEERRLDFEQYRKLQSELRESRAHAAALQAKLDLTGAIDRDRVGDALILGFYFHRRGEKLQSSPKQPVFSIAAKRLKLLNGTDEITLDKFALHEVLQMAYGPIVAEAFDLGFLLSHLGEDGFPERHPEILVDLENQLKALKLDHAAGAADLPDDTAGLFKKLASRVVSIVRQRM